MIGCSLYVALDVLQAIGPVYILEVSLICGDIWRIHQPDAFWLTILLILTRFRISFFLFLFWGGGCAEVNYVGRWIIILTLYVFWISYGVQ